MPVAVIIPTLNEAKYIGALLENICAQVPELVSEIIVTDGGSTDGTVDLVQSASEKDARVRLVDNPRKLQSAGINLAVGTLPSEISTFVRLDAHSGYPGDFLQRVLEALQESGSDSVVVRLNTVGRTCLQKAIAACMNSVFGTGGSIHRTGGVSQFVDHGHHAAFKTKSFQSAGGYNETFVANEDAEFDTRLTAQGGSIWFEASAEVEYYPRTNLKALAKQYFRYGKGRVMTWRASGQPLKPRQLIPPSLAGVLAVSLVLSLFDWRILAIPTIYLTGCFAAALYLTLKSRFACTMLAVFALPVIHVSFGTGFILQFLSGRKG